MVARTLYNIPAIIKGHHIAALEHKANNKEITHNPTLLQAVKVTLYDLIFNKTVALNGNYVVYTYIYKPTLGVKLPLIVSCYIQKEFRGQGRYKYLLSLISDKEKQPIIGTLDETKTQSSKYLRVATLYIVA